MFASVMVRTWDELREVGGRLGHFIFRGQASAEWGLQSSMERLANAGATPLLLLPSREAVVLRQFQRRAHLLLTTPPSLTSRLEWLSILQHHGGPTRLLDFTESLYVAAFFAIDACGPCDAAVWGINTYSLYLAEHSWDREKTVDEMNEQHIILAERLLSGEQSEPGVFHVQPERLNERMSLQKGTFLFPKDITQPFMQNIEATFGVSLTSMHRDPATTITVESLARTIYSSAAPRVLKIVLPRSIHEDILGDLQAMNMSASTLFPGLDGFARSLNAYLRMPEFVRELVAEGVDFSERLRE